MQRAGFSRCRSRLTDEHIMSHPLRSGSGTTEKDRPRTPLGGVVDRPCDGRHKERRAEHLVAEAVLGSTAEEDRKGRRSDHDSERNDGYPGRWPMPLG